MPNLSIVDTIMNYTSDGVRKRLSEWHQRKQLSMESYNSFDAMYRNLMNPNNLKFREKGCFIPSGYSTSPVITMEACQNAILLSMANLEMLGVSIIPGVANHDLNSRVLVNAIANWDPLVDTFGGANSRKFELMTIIASATAIASCMWNDGFSQTALIISLSSKKYDATSSNMISIARQAIEIIRDNLHFNTIPDSGAMLFPFLNERNSAIAPH